MKRRNLWADGRNERADSDERSRQSFWLTAVLAECGIDAIVLDTQMSILEGQIGVIRRRIMVIDEDFEAARAFVNSAERAFDETETVDALLDGRVLLRQPKDGYRVAIDPVLLAASIEAGAGERVFGCRRWRRCGGVVFSVALRGC